MVYPLKSLMDMPRQEEFYVRLGKYNIIFQDKLYTQRELGHMISKIKRGGRI